MKGRSPLGVCRRRAGRLNEASCGTDLRDVARHAADRRKRTRDIDSHAKVYSHVARWLPKFDTPSTSSLVSRLVEILQVESTATRVQRADGCGLDYKSSRRESIYIDRIAAHPAGFSPRLN